MSLNLNSSNDNDEEAVELISPTSSAKSNGIESVKNRRSTNNDDKFTYWNNRTKKNTKRKNYRKLLKRFTRRLFTLRTVLLLSIACFVVEVLRQADLVRRQIRTISTDRIPYDIPEIPSSEISNNPDWCLRGPHDPACSCTNPSIPKHRSKIRHWDRAHHLNKDDAISATLSQQKYPVDILFAGDSISEEWKGTRMRYPVEKKQGIIRVYESLFTKEGGGEYQALPMGISGDTSPNLLFRLADGELPSKLHPPVIWLLIGTNDFGNTWCKSTITYLGIRKVIEYIRHYKPASTLVVNSLLPRTFHRRGYVNRVQLFRHKKHHPIGPNLWKEIQVVNTALREYVDAQQSEKLLYFDATHLFLISAESKPNARINQTLMDDFVHPNAQGHLLWGKEIIRFIREKTLV